MSGWRTVSSSDLKLETFGNYESVDFLVVIPCAENPDYQQFELNAPIL